MRAKSDCGFACALHRIEQSAHLCKLIMDSIISYLQNINPDSWLRYFVFYQPSISNDGCGNAKDTEGGDFIDFFKGLLRTALCSPEGRPGPRGGYVYRCVLFFRSARLAHDIAVFIRITTAVFPQQLIELISGPVKPYFDRIQAY